MPIGELLELPVERVSAEKSHLHLWTTNAFLPDALNLLSAWGFEYKGVFLWVKSQIGIGNYWRVSHEFLVLGVRGGLTFSRRDQRSWIEHPRTKHSAKPDRVREIIELVSPAPRLEMFSRAKTNGWDVFGDECDAPIPFGDEICDPDEDDAVSIYAAV